MLNIQSVYVNTCKHTSKPFVWTGVCTYVYLIINMRSSPDWLCSFTHIFITMCCRPLLVMSTPSSVTPDPSLDPDINLYMFYTCTSRTKMFTCFFLFLFLNKLKLCKNNVIYLTLSVVRILWLIGLWAVYLVDHWLRSVKKKKNYTSLLHTL